MYNLMYKEFKLSIHPLFLLYPVLFGALMLIPQWIFSLVPLYFCFVTAPNLFAAFKANNDLNFTALLPISKRDMVKAKIGSIVIIELLHFVFALLFALLNRRLYHMENFAFDLNGAFFGFVLILFGLYNIILFPMYYKTGYKYGAPVIAATVAAVLFAVLMEMLIIINSGFQTLMENPGSIQVLMPIIGILLFAASVYGSYQLSAQLFENVDI